MKALVLDTETTTKNKGNPFTQGNKLCYTGWTTAGERQPKHINQIRDGPCTEQIQATIDSHTHFVAFNLKFDAHWLMNIGVSLENIRFWDLQYAEFLFSNQQLKYPSLEDTAVRYGLGHKVDVVSEEYWKKGIDTIDIPPEVMVQYLDQDVNLEEQIFLIQQERFRTTDKSKWRLFLLHMEDLRSLIDMERNGILYDVGESERRAEEVAVQIKDIEKELKAGLGDIPINFNSNDHVSAYLYGGTIAIDSRIPIGVYKSGAKVGLPRYKIVTHEHVLPRQVEPLKKSELAKEGYWSTNEDTLRQLRATKESKRRIGLLLEISKLEKLRGTYYQGLPKKIVEMVWANNYIHSSLNQCVAVTGRLSSSNP